MIVHEYGHHIENQLGLMGPVRAQHGPMSDSVKLGLMADYLAGTWAKNAVTVAGPHGPTLISDLTGSDVRDIIQAAQTVGDDRIEQRMQGRSTRSHGPTDP